MAVKIRLLRMGKIRNPQYRIVIADSRVKRDGKAIEYVGIYHPKEEPSRIEVKSDRVQHWLSVGAQPSEAVIAILSKTGDWQKFKGLPAPTEPLRVAAPKPSRHAAYEAAAQIAAGIEKPVAVTTKPAKKDKKVAAEAVVEAAPAVVEEPKETSAAADAVVKTPVADAGTDASTEETAVASTDEQQG